jgi:cell division protein FtsI/penicillin-binding protein 2
MSTIANDGVRMKPYLLKAVFDSKEESFSNVIYESNGVVLNSVNTEEKYLGSWSLQPITEDNTYYD